VPDEVVRRYFNRVWRWCAAYEKGLDYFAAEEQVKAHRKQRASHRGVNAGMGDTIDKAVPLPGT